MSNKLFNYVFSDIPNDDEGKAFVKQLALLEQTNFQI